MARPPHKARIHWHTWMPWYELSRQIGEAQDVAAQVSAPAHGTRALAPAVGLLVATLAGTVLVPAVALPCVVIGGLLTVVALIAGSADGALFIAAIGHGRAPRTALPLPAVPLLAAGTERDTEDTTEDGGMRVRISATHGTEEAGR